MFLHFSYSASLGVKSPTMVLKVCFMWEHPIIACVGLIFLVWELFLIWMPASSFLSMCQPLSPWWVLCRCSGQCPPLWQARAPSTYAFSGTYTTLQPLHAISTQPTPSPLLEPVLRSLSFSTQPLPVPAGKHLRLWVQGRLWAQTCLCRSPFYLLQSCCYTLLQGSEDLPPFW